MTATGSPFGRTTIPSRARSSRSRSRAASPGRAAIARELQEEISATPARIRYLGLVEDIFVWAGQERHELYLIYDVDLADRRIYEADEVQVTEDDGSKYPARWRPLSEFRGSARLVPEGLLDLIGRAT